MKTHPQSDSIAHDQAALWAARLDGSLLSADDRAALDAWLAENPAHRALLSRYCQFSTDLEVQLPALVEAGAIALPKATRAARPRWSFPRIAFGGLAATAVFALGFWIARPGDRFENFASPAGQRLPVTLADGTHVELDAHTTLQFASRNGKRRAKLSGGEAFFVVTKDKSRPFTVETPAGSVRVTGTSFDVHTEAATLDVTVVEGSVQVRPGETTLVRDLKAGDWLSASAGSVAVTQLSPAAIDEKLAWRQGIVIFNGEPLDAAVARFARYQGRSIQVSPAAATLPVSGRYSLDDLEGFLSGLEEIRVTPTTGGGLHVSRRSE